MEIAVVGGYSTGLTTETVRAMLRPVIAEYPALDSLRQVLLVV